MYENVRLIVSDCENLLVFSNGSSQVTDELNHSQMYRFQSSVHANISFISSISTMLARSECCESFWITDAINSLIVFIAAFSKLCIKKIQILTTYCRSRDEQTESPRRFVLPGDCLFVLLLAVLLSLFSDLVQRRHEAFDITANPPFCF